MVRAWGCKRLIQLRGVPMKQSAFRVWSAPEGGSIPFHHRCRPSGLITFLF